MKSNDCESINEGELKSFIEHEEKLKEENNQNIKGKRKIEFVPKSTTEEESTRKNIHNISVSRRIKIISLVSVLIIIGTISALMFYKNAGEINFGAKNKIVAKIGKETISEPVFKLYLTITQERFEAADPNVWETESNGKKMADVAKENTIKDIKLAIAAKQKIKELGIKLTDEELKGVSVQAADIMTKNVDLAKKLNFEMKDLEEFVTHGMYVLKAVQEIGKGYTPTETEINEQLEQVKTRNETATVKHVLIASKDEKSKALAKEILKQAEAGADMTELAKKYSEDPGSKDKGGEYTFPKGQMVKEFEDAAFTGEVGKVYPKLIETSYGYHIMKIEKREAGNPEQIKKDCETIAKNLYAQNELTKLSDKLAVKTTKLYDTITITK